MIDAITGLMKKSFDRPDETKHPFEKGTIEGDEPNVLLELIGVAQRP